MYINNMIILLILSDLFWIVPGTTYKLYLFLFLQTFPILLLSQVSEQSQKLMIMKL